MQKVLLRISNKHKLDFYGQSVTFVIHSQCPMMEGEKKI